MSTLIEVDSEKVSTQIREPAQPTPQNEPSFLRHSGWFSPTTVEGVTVNIIGVGATGSHIGLMMARMGFHKFQIWDADTVEAHNLPNQIYSAGDIGTFKVDAFERVLKDFNPQIEVTKHQSFFETELHKQLLSGPVVLTVDTMKARKDIYKSIRLNFKVPYTIETAVGFDFGTVSYLPLLSLQWMDGWHTQLLNDEDIPDGPCNLRICTTLVTQIASTAVHFACQYHVGVFKGEPFALPKRHMIELSNTLSVHSF